MANVDSLGLDDDTGPAGSPGDLGELSDFTDYNMDIARFRRIQRLGEGTFGTVFLAQDTLTDWKVVVKELHHAELSQREMDLFRREIHILVSAHNPFVLPCVGFSFRSPYSIVCPYMASGSLWDILHNSRGATLSATQKTCIAIGVAHGMRYLHRQGIMHRDLKSPNILLDGMGLPKIADFGLSRFMDNDSPEALVTKGIGTPQWMAPEQLGGTAYGLAVDVYAFGIILYELFTGNIPFHERKETGTQLFELIRQGVRPTINGTSDIEKLMLRCWQNDPGQRPTFEEIYTLLSTSIVQVPGTHVKGVRAFIRLRIENEVEPRNVVADMTRTVNGIYLTLDRIKGATQQNVMDWLCHFAEAGSVKDLARYVRSIEGIDINGANSLGRTPLISAAYFGHHLAVLFLLSLEGIDVNKPDKDGITPLMAAIVNGHVETVKLLLSVPGIKVNMVDVNGFTALHMVLFKAPQDLLIHELIKSGIDKNIKDHTGKSAVDYVREKDAFDFFPSLRDQKPR